MKYLEANLDWATDEALEILEERLLKEDFEGIDYEIDLEKRIVSFVKPWAEKEVSMADFIPQGTLVKSFLIENGISTAENYKARFSMKEVSVAKPKSADELDKLLFEVPKDDPKVMDVVSKLASLKKNRS